MECGFLNGGGRLWGLNGGLDGSGEDRGGVGLDALCEEEFLEGCFVNDALIGSIVAESLTRSRAHVGAVEAMRPARIE